ncbi:MAG TPA: hypothetical protein VGO70_06680 [Arsenicitalea sp.]|jgi:hypothetical protein|nr:hypothetical protein [Arsenicitalea sp.]
MSKEDDFKQRLIAVLSDLQANGRNDAELLWILGGLGSRLVQEAKRATWLDVKMSLTTEAYQSLLSTFQAQANALAAEKKAKAAYAVEILAISLIARTQKTPEITAGDALLDEFIEAAIGGYNANQTLAPAN